MRKATLIKVGKRVLQIGLPILVLFFFVKLIAGEWSQLRAISFHWDPWWMVLAFVGFIAQTVIYAFIWRSILRRMGYRLHIMTAQRIYLASEFVRYIPGNVWHVLTRTLWANKYGVPRSVGFTSMVIELLTKLAAGAFIFALSLLFWGDLTSIHTLISSKDTYLLVVLAVVLMAAVLIGLHPRVLSGVLNRALRLLKREPIELGLRYRDILIITLYWCLNWVVAGVAFYLMMISLWPTFPLGVLPVCIGIYALAWDVGFLSFITPSGLGFREGVIALLFVLALPFLPKPLGPLAAIVARVVSTLAELVCVSVAYITGSRQMREVQREQTPLSSAKTN
jgi:uncharacterized membrane protein YbhN (UPF0104 family)